MTARADRSVWGPTPLCLRLRREISEPPAQLCVPSIKMVSILLWILLLVICWPLALALLILYPLIWLILLPFRLAGIAIEGVFELIRAIFLFPARMLR